MEVKLFNEKRVSEAADFIAGELVRLVDRNNYDSPINRRLDACCPSYGNGLTIGEQLLAVLRALSQAQIAITTELASLEHGGDGERRMRSTEWLPSGSTSGPRKETSLW
jgi:hypothetical protein